MEPFRQPPPSDQIEIVNGKVVLRLERHTVSTRIAEIVTALERGA